MTDWPRRTPPRKDAARVARVSRDAVKRLPVTAGGPKVIPQPTLAPTNRSNALASALILIAVILLVLGLISYGVSRFPHLALAGQAFVAVVTVLSLGAIALFVVSLGLYVLPVLFGVRKPALEPPPTWPGIGDRH